MNEPLRQAVSEAIRDHVRENIYGDLRGVEEATDDILAALARPLLGGNLGSDPEDLSRSASGEILGLARDLEQAWQVLPCDDARASEARSIIRATINTLVNLHLRSPGATTQAAKEHNDREVEHEVLDADFCRLSVLFGRVADMRLEQDRRINDRLKRMLTAIRQPPVQQTPAKSSGMPSSNQGAPE